MGCFQVRYDSRVVIYERKLFIRLATRRRAPTVWSVFNRPGFVKKDAKKALIEYYFR